MKTVSAANYRKDKLFTGVARAVAEAIATAGFVAPVDVLRRLGRLTKRDYEHWRFGRIPCLEHACVGNLAKLNRTLRILELHCRELDLIPSQTAYRKWGGGKRVPLRFSKSGDPNLEAAYSRHYVAKGKLKTSIDGEANRRVNTTARAETPSDPNERQPSGSTLS
jgi:hypothetical protein